MTALPAHLELVVEDVRLAARRSLRRRARRRAAAAALAVLALGVGIAGAATGFDYLSLVERVVPGAQVTDLGDRQHRVIAELERGTGVDIVVTDLGVTDRDRPAPPGTSICDWIESQRSFACTAATGQEVLVPAGTHVYRINPSGILPGGEANVMLVPELRMQLVVDPTPIRP